MGLPCAPWWRGRRARRWWRWNHPPSILEIVPLPPAPQVTQLTGLPVTAFDSLLLSHGPFPSPGGWLARWNYRRCGPERVCRSPFSTFHPICPSLHPGPLLDPDPAQRPLRPALWQTGRALALGRSTCVGKGFPLHLGGQNLPAWGGWAPGRPWESAGCAAPAVLWASLCVMAWPARRPTAFRHTSAPAPLPERDSWPRFPHRNSL